MQSIRFWRFGLDFFHQWSKKERESTHNDIDLLHFNLSRCSEDIDLSICILGVGIGIIFRIKEVWIKEV